MEQMDEQQKTIDWCTHLTYEIEPDELKTERRPAMLGNGQLMLLANLDRPCVAESICFGFGNTGLRPEYGRWKVQHVVPCVYDERGRKYVLASTPSSAARRAVVTLRPDRQIWRYDFDDLSVQVSLILPRLQPGYFFRIDLTPASGNNSKQWRLFHQVRTHYGSAHSMMASEAGLQDGHGLAWWKAMAGFGEAVGASERDCEVRLGLDVDKAGNDICTSAMVFVPAVKGRSVYIARAFGPTPAEARTGVERLLEAPTGLDSQITAWWNDYLDNVPRLECPDEDLSRTFLWSWANFRVNRIDVPMGNIPAGLFTCGCGGFQKVPFVCCDNVEAEAVQLLNDPQPCRDTILFMLEGNPEGFIHNRSVEGDCTGYAFQNAWVCALLTKYILTTGDYGLLHRPVGGMTVLERLRVAIEATLPRRDERTGLYQSDDECMYLVDPSRELTLFPEGAGVFRGGREMFHSETNAAVWSAFLALAELEEMAGNEEQARRCRELAGDLYEAIQRHLWDEGRGIFYDMSTDGKISDYLGICGIITGLYPNQVRGPGGIATQEQAAKLAGWCDHPELASDYGVTTVARSHQCFEWYDYNGFSGGLDMLFCNQIPMALYGHGFIDAAHRHLFKLFRRLSRNGGLGPRYRGEVNNPDTGEILPWRSVNYPATLSALTSVTEGVFGLRWTGDALTVDVNSPWPWARLRNLRIRDRLLDLELGEDGCVRASIDGREVGAGTDRKLYLPWDTFAFNQV